MVSLRIASYNPQTACWTSRLALILTALSSIHIIALQGTKSKPHRCQEAGEPLHKQNIHGYTVFQWHASSTEYSNTSTGVAIAQPVREETFTQSLDCKGSLLLQMYLLLGIIVHMNNSWMRSTVNTDELIENNAETTGIMNCSELDRRDSLETMNGCCKLRC